MSDWSPRELVDEYDGSHIAEEPKNIYQTENSFEKSFELKARLIKSKGENSSLLAAGSKEEVKKRLPSILDMSIGEQLRLAGIFSERNKAIPKPVNHEVKVHGKTLKLREKPRPVTARSQRSRSSAVSFGSDFGE